MPIDTLRRSAGFTILEATFVTALMGILLAAAVPQMLGGLERARAFAAARYLAQLCAQARFQAVGRARYVALRFTAAGDDYRVQLHIDGNRNGVRSAEATAGIDAPVGAVVILSLEFPGVRIGLDPSLGLGSDPIRLSGSSLLSYSPEGTATAGSVYVLGRDGTQLVVRILGVTGRTRVLRYQRSTGSWEQL